MIAHGLQGDNTATRGPEDKAPHKLRGVNITPGAFKTQNADSPRRLYPTVALGAAQTSQTWPDKASPPALEARAV